jgi:hypothetical protein
MMPEIQLGLIHILTNTKTVIAGGEPNDIASEALSMNNVSYVT